MVGLFRRRLSVADQARIAAAVADLERRTSAELAIAIARRSASYAVYSALWSCCATLLAGWVAALLDPEILASHLFLVQALTLVVAVGLLSIRPIGIRLVPPVEKRVRCAAMARREFLGLVNNRTRGRDGVLLYLSVAERYVEIIADNAVSAAIARERWQEIVGAFGARAQRMRLGDNLLQLIDECAAVLEARFPPKPGQSNELSDRIREI